MKLAHLAVLLLLDAAAGCALLDAAAAQLTTSCSSQTHSAARSPSLQ